jgi:hypothetical protein
VAVKLYRCSNQWVKVQGHPCWKVESALIETGVEYERVPGPLRKSKRDALEAGTGQRLYPAIKFEDGTWYREQSTDMAQAIRDGKLMEHAGGSAPADASLQ